MKNFPRIVTSVDEFIEVISEDRVWLSFEDFSLISEVLEIRIHIIDVYNAQMKDRLDFHLTIYGRRFNTGKIIRLLQFINIKGVQSPPPCKQ